MLIFQTMSRANAFDAAIKDSWKGCAGELLGKFTLMPLHERHGFLNLKKSKADPETLRNAIQNMVNKLKPPAIDSAGCRDWKSWMAKSGGTLNNFLKEFCINGKNGAPVDQLGALYCALLCPEALGCKGMPIDMLKLYTTPDFASDALIYGIQKFYPNERLEPSTVAAIRNKTAKAARLLQDPSKREKMIWGEGIEKVPFEERNTRIHEFYHSCSGELGLALVKASEPYTFSANPIEEGGTEFLAGLTSGYADSYGVQVKEIIISIDSGAITLDEFAKFYFLGKAGSKKCSDFFSDYDVFISSNGGKRDIDAYLEKKGIVPSHKKFSELKQSGFFSENLIRYIGK